MGYRYSILQFLCCNDGLSVREAMNDQLRMPEVQWNDDLKTHEITNRIHMIYEGDGKDSSKLLVTSLHGIQVWKDAKQSFYVRGKKKLEVMQIHGHTMKYSKSRMKFWK